jgi:hypothetical protein
LRRAAKFLSENDRVLTERNAPAVTAVTHPTGCIANRAAYFAACATFFGKAALASPATCPLTTA